MKRLVSVLTILLSITVSGYAYYFRSYQVENGLAHNSVWAVMQDSRGFMWFGTNDGLNRFDGKTFKVFRHIENDTFSIGNNFIHCLKEDSQGRFFVGTKEGLYLYDSNSETFRPVDLNSGNNKVSINTVYETPEGVVYVTTHGQGLYILNADLTLKKRFVRGQNASDLPSNYIWTVVQDYVGNVWLGTAGEGLVLFDTHTGKFTKIRAEKDFDLEDLTVNSLFCDVNYNLWIGTASGGLCRYNYRTGKTYRYMQNEALNIKSITEYSDNELIMGCERGLVTFNLKTETAHFLNNEWDGMTDNSVFSIIRDNEGAFWIGTYFGGVNYFSPEINKFACYYSSPQNSPKKNIVSSFAQDENGKIWISSYNDGVSLLNPQTGCFEDTRTINDFHNIQDIYYDNGKLYISLYGAGITVFDAKTSRITPLHARNPEIKKVTGDFITTIFKTSKGDFLFCSEERTSRYNPQTQTAERIERLTSVPVKGVAEDYNGALWFACHAQGLFRLTADGNWKTFDNLPNKNINCVYQDSKFRIWIGTEGSGLAVFNPQTEQFQQTFTQQNGLPSNIVYSILDDGYGNIWASTGGGLVKIETDLKTVKRFGFLNDIQKIRYNPKAVLRTADNYLYFGGANGFIAFNPKDITENTRQPALVITGFHNAGKTTETGNDALQNITLERFQSTFSFDFMALSYISPAQNSYAYMLEGFDAEWNYTGDNRATYMNIPTGEYVFKVKGANNDGVWSDVQSVYIRVKPHFLAAWFMILLYILLGLSLVAYFLLAYKKRLDKRNQEKIYKYKIEKEKEIYQTKIDFFTNIAHEIRTPLSLITAPLESIIVSGDGNAKTRNNLDIIKINANRLLELINQLLDFRKVEENMFHYQFKYQDVVKIVRKVYEQYESNAKMNNIEISFHPEVEELKSNVDKEAVYKIVSNLISNAVKHTQSKIEIKLETKESNIYISVTDDGAGIDKKYLDAVFEPFFQISDNANGLKTGTGLGLSLSKSLAEKHNGDITAISAENEGSTFTLRLPVTENDNTPAETETSTFQPEASVTIETGHAPSLQTRILVAEDNRDLRDFLINSLCEDFTVFGAENGAEALKIIEKESIDLIISDIMMPEMDGLELCNRVKSDVSYSHIPLILLSAKTDTPTKIEGLSKGADVYLDKPFSFEQLRAQINSIIENRNHIRLNFIKSPLQYFKQNASEDDDGQAEFIEKLNAMILANMDDENFTIDVCAGQFAMSRSNFHKKIKNITGMTPNDYIKLIRLTRSAQLLASGKYKINEVCYMTGFNTPSYFSKCFYDHFGKLPREFMEVKN
ncbi:MAG: response regulator [Dysgonamonadaceae bacterium]|jgi:signal transduction histidine kinase/ligand-binding sensor domain-containing protein/DNA-binding response OmpR family regulator|nr:response regulator [Dysgonamonadaceae bacterium]